MEVPKDPLRAVSLQERDFELIRGLFECRAMTAEHVSLLYFDGKREAAKKRLQKLKAAGYIGERPRRSFEAAVHILTRLSYQLLDERGVLRNYPELSIPALEKRGQVSDLTLRHELEVMDVKAAFHTRVRNSEEFGIEEFGTWPRLYQFEATHSGSLTLVRPDGFVRIHEKEKGGGLSEHTFFLELDRSTESQDILVSRAVSYLDYYKSGGFAARSGAARSAFREYPFRVLMVFKTAERRNNITERLLQSSPPILAQVCLSTIAEVRKDPLSAIWIRPIDYRAATKQSEFCTETARPKLGYQRQTARDHFVDAEVRKITLLNGE